jgi:hypothetical protein
MNNSSEKYEYKRTLSIQHLDAVSTETTNISVSPGHADV